MSVLLRLQLSSSGNLLLTEHLYNVMVTAHGLVMVFFLAIPVLIGGFGN